MKILNIVGVAALIFVAIMWHGDRQDKQALQGENVNLKDSIEYQQDSINELDSAYTVEINKSDSLAKRAKKFEKLWWLEKEAKKGIKSKYDSLKAEVDSMSIDSLAQYIVDHYAGDNYELLDVGFVEGDSSIYVAFQDITAKDIVDTHIDYRERGEIIDNQGNQIEYLKNIKGIREDEIATLTKRNDNLELQVEKINRVKNMYRDLASEYEEEAIKQRNRKLVGYGVAIAEGIAILILL